MHRSMKLTREEKQDVYGKLPRGGINGKHYLKMTQQSVNLFEDAPEVEDTTKVYAEYTPSTA